METRHDSPLTHDENEEFLRTLRETRTRLGIHRPRVEVRFENLTVCADAYEGHRSPPNLWNVVINTFLEKIGSLCLHSTKKRSIKILNQVTGMISPCRMTLVLGPPGSGRSTFLRALSGKLGASLKLTGKVTYNGEELTSYSPQHMNVYVSQNDLHHPEMTVRQIFDFSAKMFKTNNALDKLIETMGGEKATNNMSDFVFDAIKKATTCGDGRILTTNYILKMLRLCECADIVVGNEMRRGISGGQKKRVTIGEMLISFAKCFFMDDISTGLDSSTTFEIIKFLKQLAQSMDLTMVISLLQPPPEMFELFDDIILLCDGQIVYQGARENINQFFENMGFKCPHRKNVADFLQEVTSKMDQKQFWVRNNLEYEYIPVEKFVESFRSFHLGQLIEERLHKKNKLVENYSQIQSNGRHNISKWEIFKACFSRELLLLKMNSSIHIFKSIQIAFLAFVVTTLFLRIEMKHHSVTDGNKYMGALFIGVVIVKFNGMTELAMMTKRLPIFYRQRELLNLPAWALISSMVILSLPLSIVETSIWTCSTYYFIGFAPSTFRFFQQLLTFFCVHQMSTSLYRFIAALGRTPVMANTLGAAALMAICLFGGFIRSKDNIEPWLLWGYWVSPLTYAQNAVALNEFLDVRWSMDFQDENIDADTVGKAILKSRGMLTEWHWFWICVGALLGLSLIFSILSIFALQFLNSPHQHQVSSEIKEDKKQNDRADEKATCRISPTSQIVLPFQPLRLVFSHISYSVDLPAQMKKKEANGGRLQLLQDISGVFRPGMLTALMGITGAGKTTLLDVLAGRKTGGYVEGSISISGHPKNQEMFSRVFGYCEQSDIHSPFITIFESLQFSASLRLPSDIEPLKRDMLIEEVMGLVELTAMKNKVVGIPGMQGLSAGQRKRLTIAIELVSNPSIIFMDEPTSSLDARAAAIVMRAVRKTVDSRRTVVCTIHQPSIEIFESFDELLLMKQGGKLIYSGSLGPLSQRMIKYFEVIPGVPKIKNRQNPAAWMLDISSQEIECRIGVDYSESFRSSSLHRENLQLVDELSKSKPDEEELHFPPGYWQSFRSQCVSCLWKQHKSYWKNPEHNIVRFVNTFATSLLFGFAFWQVGAKIRTEQDIFNILGVMYGSALFLGFVNATTLQPIVGLERAVFYRERSSGMYSSMSYAIAQVSIEFPYIVLQVLIFSLIVYPMIGFQLTVVKFFWFMLFILLSFIYYTLYGMMTVALTPNQEIAAALAFVIFVLWNVFSGFIISRKMIPIWWAWFYWANPAAWTIYGLMLSQLGDRADLIHVPGWQDQTTAEFLGYYLGYQENHFPVIIILHFVIILLFFFVFAFSIKHLNFQKR